MRKLILIATAALVAGSLAAEAQDKLRLGTEGAYPPFNYFDTAGNLVGFDIDIGLALCEHMQVECELVAQDWDGIIPGLLAEKYDFIIASMFITDERRKQVSFTDPYYLAAMTHVAPKDSGIAEFTDAAMAGKVVGALSGSTQADFIQEMYPSAEIRLYPTQDEVNLDLASGRLDVQVSDMLPMIEWVTKTDDGACCELTGEPITDPKWVGDGVGIAVRQADNDLREKMNVALKEIREDGTYKAINDKYFPIDIFTMK